MRLCQWILLPKTTMDLFCKRYFIVFFIILTQNFPNIFASNVTSEEKTIAKVLSSFLKVPWIDPNSASTSAAASTCSNDIATVYRSADAGEMWALEMLDAASKIPAGILIGNIWDLGMYDECVNVKGHNNPENIQGRHCIISLSIPTKFFGDTSRMMRIQKLIIHNPSAGIDLSLSMSVCVPSSCGIQDVHDLVNASIKNMPEMNRFEVGVAKVGCSGFESPSELALGSILVILLFSIGSIFFLSCTVCDFILRTRSNDDGLSVLKIFSQFSLYTNASKLLYSELGPDTLPAIHGIRVLSIFSIVLGHRCAITLLETTVNVSDIYELMQSMISSFIFTLPFVVDTFFVMSGFLVAYSFLKALQSGVKRNVFIIYLHRYMRLTPSVAILLLFTIFILPYLGSGPIWERVFEATAANCQNNWWTNILYVQNIVNIDKMCLMHTWYLAVDMQLFLLSPLILYPLFYWPKIGLAILNLLLIASFATPAIQLGINQWSAFFTFSKSVPEVFSESLHFYPMTYNRALPYLLGIFIAYYALTNGKRFSKIQVAINWILAISFVLLCGWASQYVQPKATVYNVIWETVYVSVVRFGWSIAMSWIIYACTRGYGGFVTKFLSLPIFVPLSRLSYSIYLVHLVLQLATGATMRTAVYMTPFSVMYLIWGDLVLSIAIAFVLCICCESPIILLWKMFTSDLSSTSVKCDSITKKANILAGIYEYLKSDLIKAKVSSDIVIETITSRLDFWQTISDELNALYEGPSKTPAQWSKSWQDWRLKLLKIEGIRKPGSEGGIQKEKLQLQSKVIEIEKELIVFLAAMNCYFSDNTNFQNSPKINIKPNYQSNCSSYRQNDNSIRLSISDFNRIENGK